MAIFIWEEGQSPLLTILLRVQPVNNINSVSLGVYSSLSKLTRNCMYKRNFPLTVPSIETIAATLLLILIIILYYIILYYIEHTNTIDVVD